MKEPGAVALVTGGARRIGRAIVEDLAASGFSVVIHAHRSLAEAEDLAGGLRSGGASVGVVGADLTNAEHVDSLMSRAAGLFGPVQVLVNNASIFERDDARDFTREGWERHFAVHALTPSILARELARQLPGGADGLVVNIVDQRVLKTVPDFFTYGLSKAAQWAATRTLAQALAPRVRVNAIGPGPTLKSARQEPADFETQVAALILGRGPELSEFGATVRYFWEARSVTGQMIALDGGQHLDWRTPDIAGGVE